MSRSIYNFEVKQNFWINSGAYSQSGKNIPLFQCHSTVKILKEFFHFPKIFNFTFTEPNDFRFSKQILYQKQSNSFCKDFGFTRAMRHFLTIKFLYAWSLFVPRRLFRVQFLWVFSQALGHLHYSDKQSFPSVAHWLGVSKKFHRLFRILWYELWMVSEFQFKKKH